MSSVLEHAVETLPGIGPRSGAALRERGYETVGDLLWLLPRSYDDQRRVTPIAELEDGTYAVVEGRVSSAKRFPRGGHMGLDVRIEPDDGTPKQGLHEQVKLVWFRAVPGLTKRFAVGSAVRVAGQVRDYRGIPTMAHPEVLDAAQPGVVQPRYPEVPGVRRKALRRAVRAAVDRARDSIPDLLPASVRSEVGVGSVSDALVEIHVPGQAGALVAPETAATAQRRLALEELVLWEVALRLRRERERGGMAQAFQTTGAVDRAIAAFTFELTEAQRLAISALGRGLRETSPMRCLLQGDVGCGKTAVALVACAQVVAGGAQAALLAPTELLAEQHIATVRPTAERLGLRVGLFTGTLSKDQRRVMLDRMATGAVDLVVGTHALLSGDIRFANLGLLVVDEQHRFGVSQRLRLSGRQSTRRPHLVVMTATPIPRSLALVLYAGLDLVTIAQKPPGRVSATTKMVPRSSRKKVHRQIERAIAAGGRAFVVCPAIAGSDDLVGVDAAYDELVTRFGNAAVGVVHGRLSGEERREQMRAFADGEVHVLVGTTVLEVGVDVPSANLMVIEQADRFGLAQLHQLRGRVGRAGQKSACLLTYQGPLSEEAQARLEALCETDDGFRLAETDLELRGPGHFFGYRQSGASGLRFADLRDESLLRQAGAIAERIVALDPDLGSSEHRALRAAVERWERYEAVREEAG